jgi:hypothetical protein
MELHHSTKSELTNLFLDKDLVGDSSSYLIQDLPINLKAGETFNQDITWVLDYVPASGNYEVRAALIMPGSVFVTQSVTPVTLTAP